MAQGRPHDLEGHKFGRWTVIGLSDGKKGHNLAWHCRCQCGTERDVAAVVLISGKSQSCGCYRREVSRKLKITNGNSSHPLYRTWINMWRRCTNPNNKYMYALYKDRVPVDRWRDFRNFVEDMGPKPGSDYSLERIRNEERYGPNNCKWATRAEQMRNTSRTLRITLNGVTKSAVEWAEELGLSYATIRYRVNQGWSEDRILGVSK